VIGSGGALPTNWANFKGFGDLEVTGSGTEAGMAYVDVRFYGTNSTGSSSALIVGAEQFAQIVAASGQTWAGNFYVKLHEGSLAGVSEVAIVIRGRQSDTGGTETTVVAFAPTSSLVRYTAIRALNNALTARVSSDITVTVANGATIDLTLRIAAPQLEQGAFPTSYIPTTSAAVTRQADSAIVNPISSFYNASEGTLFAEYRTGAGTPVAGAMVIDDGTNDNRVGLFLGASQIAIAATYTSVGSVSPVANTIFKSVLGYRANDHAASVNGAAVATNTAIGVPSGLTTLGIGAEAGGTYAQPCAHIRRIAYFPKRLSNALLQSLTT
jgi:hypothetical protein